MPKDDATLSAASAGSQPMAWAVMQPDSYRVFESRCAATNHQMLCGGGDIVPLYRSPTITDEEREAIEWAFARATVESMTTVASRDAYRRSCVLRHMLERTLGSRETAQ